MWIGQPDSQRPVDVEETPAESRSAYKRATHHGVDVRETSGREQRRERDVSMQNVVRDNDVKGL